MSKLGHQIGIYRYDEASLEPDKFEKIGRVVSFSGLKLSSEVVDATEYSDDADGWNKFEAAMKDGGEISIGIRYEAGNPQADALEDAQDTGDIEKIKIQFPVSYNKRFILDTLVTGVEYATEKGGLKERNFTHKVSGKPDIGPLS